MRNALGQSVERPRLPTLGGEARLLKTSVHFCSLVADEDGAFEVEGGLGSSAVEVDSALPSGVVR